MPKSEQRADAGKPMTMFVGFYVAAFVAVGVTLGVAFLLIRDTQLVGLVGAIVPALVIAWIVAGIFPKSRQIELSGVPLSEQLQPDLFALIKNVAKATDQPMPDEVLLTSEMEARLVDHGTPLKKGERTLLIGLPFLHFLTVPQVRATLAHEFGHFSSIKSAKHAEVYRLRAAVDRQVSGLLLDDGFSKKLYGPYRAFGRAFVKAASGVATEQELAADQVGAKVTDNETMGQALIQMVAGASAWKTFWQNEVDPILNVGLRPSLIIGYAHFVRAPGMRALLDVAIRHRIATMQEAMDETHPSLNERLKALGVRVETSQLETGSALELLSDLPRVEESVLRATLTVAGFTALKPATSDEIVRRVSMPRWWEIVERHSRALNNVTAGSLAEHAGDLDSFAQRLRVPADTPVAVEERRRLAASLLGCGFALALVRSGWNVQALADHEIVCRKGDATIEPFTVIDKLCSGELSAEAWRGTCELHGLSSTSLVPLARTVPIGWSLPEAA